MRTLRMVTVAALVWIAAMGLTTRGQMNPPPPTQGSQGPGQSSRTTIRPSQPQQLGPMELPSKSPRSRRNHEMSSGRRSWKRIRLNCSRWRRS